MLLPEAWDRLWLQIRLEGVAIGIKHLAGPGVQRAEGPLTGRHGASPEALDEIARDLLIGY